MRAGCRSILMWLLLLALPVQGLAAATMLHCGAHHLRMGSATDLHAVPAPVHDHAQHHHDGARHHVAHHMAHHTTHHAMQADADTSGAGLHQLDQFAKFKCSACAACCMGVALPPAILVLADVPAAPNLTPFVPTTHPDFVAAGLERPPRSLRL